MDLKKHHIGLLNDICFNINNCGSCLCENGTVHCDPSICVPAQDVTEAGFIMDPYSDSTNHLLAQIAAKHGYCMELLHEEADKNLVTGLQFTKA